LKQNIREVSVINVNKKIFGTVVALVLTLAVYMVGYMGEQLLVWGVVGNFGTRVDLHSLRTRIAFSIGFLAIGSFYSLMNRTFWKFWIGVIEIAVGMWSNWHQLTQMAVGVAEVNFSARILFVVGGVVLIAKGFDDAIKGFPRWIAYRNNPDDRKGWIEPF
jgi:hypothetical protein